MILRGPVGGQPAGFGQRHAKDLAMRAGLDAIDWGQGAHFLQHAVHPVGLLPVHPQRGAGGKMRRRLGDAGARLGPGAGQKDHRRVKIALGRRHRGQAARLQRRKFGEKALHDLRARRIETVKIACRACADQQQAPLRRGIAENKLQSGTSQCLLFFHGALQRMLLAARKFHHLGHLGFGDLVRKHADDRHALAVDGQHDLDRLGAGHVEQPLKHMHDEFHGRNRRSSSRTL